MSCIVARFVRRSGLFIFRLSSLTALMTALVLPPVAASQAPSAGVMADDRAGQACLDTLSDANLSRVTVSQHAVMTEANPAVVTQTALISQHIAVAARTALGGAGARTLLRFKER